MSRDRRRELCSAELWKFRARGNGVSLDEISRLHRTDRYLLIPGQTRTWRILASLHMPGICEIFGRQREIYKRDVRLLRRGSEFFNSPVTSVKNFFGNYIAELGNFRARKKRGWFKWDLASGKQHAFSKRLHRGILRFSDEYRRDSLFRT